MLKKIYIVKKKEQFNDIIRTGKVIKNREFVLYYKENHLDFDRFGISVGTKLGNAVFRNEYKRKIRAIIYQNKRNKQNNQKNKDFIIILRSSAKNATYQELNSSYNELIQKGDRL